MSRHPSSHGAFDRRRSFLLSVAYRMLADIADAAEGRIRATRLVPDPEKSGGALPLQGFEKEVSGWAMRRSS